MLIEQVGVDGGKNLTTQGWPEIFELSVWGLSLILQFKTPLDTEHVGFPFVHAIGPEAALGTQP
jgi:hypothetical protein